MSDITIGNKAGAVRGYLVQKFNITPEQAKSILDSEPYRPSSREDQHKWVDRVITKAKAA